MYFLVQYLTFSLTYQSAYSLDAFGNDILTCVPLAHSGNYSLNKYLCEEVGLKPCNNNIGSNGVNSTYLSLNKNVVLDSPNPKVCLKKVLSLLATLACSRSNGSGLVGGNLKTNDITGNTTAFISPSICQDIWESCSPRGSSDYAYLFRERESLIFCNNLASADSKVKLSQCDVESAGCLGNVVGVTVGEIAEVNWLLGGGIDLELLRYKIGGTLIIVTFSTIALTLLFIKRGKWKGRVKSKWKGLIVDFDLNLM